MHRNFHIMISTLSAIPPQEGSYNSRAGVAEQGSGDANAIITLLAKGAR